MKERREAMQIMEALSGVDGELLERSEAAAPDDAAGKERRGGFAWGYWRRSAAVLALIAVGAASWGGYMLVRESEKSADGAAPELKADLALSGGGEGQFTQDNCQPVVPGGDVTDGAAPAASGIVTESYMQAEMEALEKEPANCDGEGLSQIADSLQSCLPQLKMSRLQEDEAREFETLGAYVPSTLPSGYVFESAYYDEEKGALRLCWSRGMDSVMLSVRQESGAETVDVTRPELYDGRLYEIPYGESVPQEYWETFHSPVFAKNDFSLEIVRSRVISYSGGSGDTDTPRGSFAVLYDAGVLVSFSGCGTPEQIWEMFASVPGEE